MKVAFIDDDVTDRTIMKTIVENYQEIIPYRSTRLHTNIKKSGIPNVQIVQ